MISSQTILIALFCIYLIMGSNPPAAMATIIDTTVGKIVVAVSAMCLFAYSNPALGVLGMFVAFELVRRSMVVTGSAAMEMYYPTEANKWIGVPKIHDFPYTLEQEMVKKMTSRTDANFTKAPFRPTLNDVHDATYLQ
jgi:hypothetical protein